MTVKEIMKLTKKNKIQIQESANCVCLACGGNFPSIDVDKYSGDTALCPVCGIPFVIGDSTGYPIGESSAVADLRGILHEP